MTRLLLRWLLLLAVAAGGYYWLGWGGVLFALIGGAVFYQMFTPPPRYRTFGPSQAQEAADNDRGHFGGFYHDEPAEGLRGKIQRNDPCPCGSGLKYKRCHGANHTG